MKKKLMAAAVCAVMAVSGVSMTAQAETDDRGVKLPFTVEAPATVSLSGTGESDSQTTLNVTWSMNDSMCQWLSEAADPDTHGAVMERLQKEDGLTDLAVTTQIDWAIDDPVNGWHWTKYWDGEEWTDEEGHLQWSGYGNDKEYQIRTGEWDILECLTYPKTVNECWILRGRSVTIDPTNPEEEKRPENEWFYGNERIPGLKNQLKDDQYRLVEVDPDSHEYAVQIDWTQHTAYVRVRYAVTVWQEEPAVSMPIFSDWSETAAFGKEAEQFVPFTKETLAAPVISHLRYYAEEFNGYPQIAVTLTVPEALSKNLTEITARGGDIHVEWEARVPDGNWYGMQGDGTVTAGENVIALQALAESIIRENSENGVSTPAVLLAKDAPIELRARYYCSQYESYGGEYIGEFYSDYSEVLTFGTQEMSHTETSQPTESSVPEESVKPSESKPAEVSRTETPAAVTQSKCYVCRHCSAPLGICIYIWIIILVFVVIIAAVVVFFMIKNRNKKQSAAVSSDDTPHQP